MPIPQELFFLVGWASCPSHQWMKRIFARDIITTKLPYQEVKPEQVRGVVASLSILSHRRVSSV